VLGPRRCREIENDSSIGMMVAAMKELNRAETINVSNAELAARMLAAMVCEAALLLADAVKPAEFKRDAIVIVNRALDAFGSGGV
jgi:hypothetical protein